MNSKEEEPFSEWAKALRVKRPASRLCAILEDIRLAFVTGSCSGNNRRVDVQMAVLPLVSTFTELLRDGKSRVVKGVLQCLKEVCTLLSSDDEDASVVVSHVLSTVSDAAEAGLGQSKTEVRAAAHTFLFTLATVRMECKPELQEVVVVKVLSCCVKGHKNSLVRLGALSLMEALMNSDSECTSSHSTTNTTLVKSPSAWKLVTEVITDGLEDPSSEVKTAARSLAVKLQLPQISVVHSAGGFRARKAGTGELRTEPSHFDPFEALSPIQPIPVTSEKHLFRELEPIRIALNHESDWQGWVTALRKLAGLSMGVMMKDGTKLDLPQSFVSAVRGEGLHDAVAIRITDLRSAVCREACFVVTCMANALGGEISVPLAETWLTAALRNATNVKEVMSASASAAVREIIRSASPGGSPRLIPILLDGMKAKAHTMRAQCLHGICLALSHWEPKVLEAANKQGCCATDVLAKALSDADQGVRVRARVAYFICQRCIPAFADAISANIHSSTKRHLLNDRATEIEAKELVAAGCEGGERNNEEQRCLPNQPPLPDVRTRMQQPTVPHVGRRRVGRGAVRAVATLNDDNNKHQQHNMNLHLPPQRVTTTKQQLRGGGGSVGHDYVPVDGVPHTPAPAIRIRDKQQQQHVSASALRVVPGVNSGNVASREDTIVSRSSSNSLLSNVIGPQQAASRSDSTDTTTVSSASNLNTGTSKRAFQQEMEKCLIGCGDKHWAVRRESLEQLQALLSSSSGKETALEGHCGRKFLLRLGEACEDSNHLCALCGLELLHALLPHVNHSSLGSLFPRVFVHLGSVKGGLRATATAIIESARQSIEPAQLCAAICPRILDPPPEKARAAMVEFITGITPLAESHFKLPSNLRGYIARLATLLGSAGSGHSSVAAARKGLKALYCLDCEGVINAVATLPHATQKAAKGTMAGFSEGIQQQKEKQEQEQYPVQEQLHIQLQPLQEKMSQQPPLPQSERQTKQRQKSPLGHKQLPYMQTQGNQQPTEEGLPDLPEGTQQKQRHEHNPVPCAQEKSLQQQPENREQQQLEKHTKQQQQQQQKMPPSIRQPLSCSTTYIQPQEVPSLHFQLCKDQVSSVEKMAEQQHQLPFNKKCMQSDNRTMLETFENSNLNLSVESMMSGLCANASTRERVTALKALRLVATNGGVTFWKQYFLEVLTLLLDGAKGNNNKSHGGGGDGVDENNPNPPPCTTITSKEEIHRSKLIQGIRCLIAHQGSLFPPHTEFVVDRLLNFSILISSPLVRAESLAALRDLINVLDSSRYMQCLLHRMHPRYSAATEDVEGGPSYNNNVRNESLEIFISLIPVLPLSVLLDTLHGSLLPGALDGAFDTKDDMATRQLAVKAYVMMYKSLGNDLDIFMNSMPVHRQKLIHIYIDKDAQSITTEPPT